jgi:hypothetical protein
VARSSANTRAIHVRRGNHVSPYVQCILLRCITEGLSNLYPTAWSVSLNPKGGTYAATGGSGSVSIHSAEPETFGERRTVLPSGRGKFGMRCSHVGIVCASFFDKWLKPCRAPMVLEWHYLLTVARFSYSILPRAPSLPHIHHMPWLSAPCHGLPTRRSVPAVTSHIKLT